MDLIKLITDKVQEIETSGRLEEIIEKNVVKCLEDVVRDSFEWSGEAKKSIKTALEGKLNVSLERIDLSRYNKIVSTIVENQVNTTVVKNLQEDLESTISKITGILDKKEWKLSEIMEEFIKSLDTSYDGDMEELYGECTLIVDKSGNFTRVYFDREEGKSEYECSEMLHLHHGKLFHAKADGQDFSPFMIRGINTFEAFLFSLYCNQVTITVDEDSCRTEYYREDCR